MELQRRWKCKSLLALPTLCICIGQPKYNMFGGRETMWGYEFTVVMEKDEDGRFVAICPALQGCYTEGETEEEARELIADAIRLRVESRIARKELQETRSNVECTLEQSRRGEGRPAEDVLEEIRAKYGIPR
jgi:predicted RNase H-like HicB family nuclease